MAEHRPLQFRAMEIIDSAEVFTEKDNDLEFDYTRIVFKRDEKIFYAKSPHRRQHNSDPSLCGVSLVEIPVNNIWPTWQPKFIQAPHPLPPRTYVKKPSFLGFDPTTSSELGNLLLVEAEVCQILMEHPHPNIAKYLGCVVESSVIKGLCFVEYSTTLAQKVREGGHIDISRCMQGIESGVRHMHSLGFIHNDLTPFNIMMDGDGPVIIDFDSSTPEGKEVGWKKGTLGWSKEGVRYAEPENDFHSIAKIRAFMMKVAK